MLQALATSEDSTDIPRQKRNKMEQNEQFNINHAMAASFRPGKLTRMEILTRLFPLQKRDVLELVLQGCNGDAMKAIEHFLSADESTHCDQTNFKQANLEIKNGERKSETKHIKENRNNLETKATSENNKTLETTPTFKPLNLTWDCPARTDVFTPNWSSFRFGTNSTLLSNTSNLHMYQNSLLNESPQESLLTCFTGRPNFVHPPTISPFYYPGMPLRSPTYK